MNARVEDRVEGWNFRPFSGGHGGLRDLADEEFSGVVEADGGPWLCMLNGRIVGVFDGRIEDFEDAEGTTYVAPDEALPLLFAMWERDGTLEDQYYTQETPISQAHETLSSGGFSGYIELSNNVLSGDYYLCYYGDRSRSLAFIGSNERLVTGDEAFERADDEVGIYDVYSVDLGVVDVPDAASGGGGADGTEGGATSSRNVAADTDVYEGQQGRAAGDASDRGPDAVEDRPGETTDRGRGGVEASGGGAAERPGPGGDSAVETDPDGSDPLSGPETTGAGDGPPERSRSDDAAGVDREDPSRESGGTGNEARSSGASRDESRHLDAEARTTRNEEGRPDRSADSGEGRSPHEERATRTDAGSETRSVADTAAGDADENERREGRDRPPEDRSAPQDRERSPDGTTGGDDRRGGETTTGDGSAPVTDDRPPEERRTASPEGERSLGAQDRRRDAADSTPAERPRDGDASRRDRSTGPDRDAGRSDQGGDTDTRQRESQRGSTDQHGRRSGDAGPPSGSESGRADAGPRTTDSGGESTRRRQSSSRDDRRSGETAGDQYARDRSEGPTDDQYARGQSPEEVDRLRERLRDHETTIDRLRDRIAALESDRDALGDPARLRTRVDEIDSNLSQLRRTVMRLDDTVEDLRAGQSTPTTASGSPDREEGSTADATAHTPDPGAKAEQPGGSGAEPDRPDPSVGVDLSVDEALEETTVLVRYGSQSRATLKHAHAGESDREAVNENLALNAHTSFEDSTATVEERPYHEFLEERLEYRFFEWLVRDLPYAISESGNEGALSELYDAIPRIDRAEFRGTIEVGEGGEDDDSEVIGFDLVARDDRDTPLVAMNFHDSRDPATEDMVVELTEGAGAVCEAAGLNAAFLVTTSYFDGAAKDVVEEATGGSLLSRSSKKSFVRVSRRRGYHLCLAAVSDGDFHLKMPDL